MRTGTMNADERIAFERLDRACDLIRSAYRLHPLDPAMTVSRVKGAITSGMEDAAEDMAEAVSKL